MQAAEVPGGAPKPSGAGRIVLRNTMYLGIAEVVSMPMSILVNAMMGRYLGPADIGDIYLATTIAGLAFLAITWGHGGSLPAAVVADHASAGVLLGSSLAWRLAASAVGYVLLALGCHLFGFTATQQWAVGLVFLASLIQSLVQACQEAIRGFERTDIAAYSRVGLQFVSTLLVIPVLMLGGGLRQVLLVQALSMLLILIPVLRVLRPVGVGKLGWDANSFRTLMVHGTPFALFGLAVVLQPNVDAFYLAKLSSSEVVGWYAVARKLLGVLLIPATSLIGALYATSVRLWLTDREGFQQTTRNSLSTVSLLVMPVALGCALYPDVGVSIFGRESFGPSEDVLRYSAPYLFLVYFSMPLGCALVAAKRERAWTLIQLGSVVNNAVLDPFLIDYFESTHHNGGLGLGVATGISEALMIAAGVVIMPRGILDRAFAKTLSLSLLSGGAMAGAAFALRGLPSLVAAPIAVLAYGGAAYLSGAISKQQVAELIGAVRRKLGRNKGAPA